MTNESNTDDPSAGQANTQEPGTPGTALDLSKSFDMDEYNALRGFVLYMRDMGVRAFMLRLIAASLYPNITVPPNPEDKTAAEIFDSAVADVKGSSSFISLEDLPEVLGTVFTAIFGEDKAETEAPKRRQMPQFDLRKVAGGAISLKLLWDYALDLPEFVLPQHCRPSVETINRCLYVFHVINAERLAEQAGTD